MIADHVAEQAKPQTQRANKMRNQFNDKHQWGKRKKRAKEIILSN